MYERTGTTRHSDGVADGRWASLGERGEEGEPLIQAIATFEEAGVGNGGTGLVITGGDGSEFRVSIARNS